MLSFIIKDHELFLNSPSSLLTKFQGCLVLDFLGHDILLLLGNAPSFFCVNLLNEGSSIVPIMEVFSGIS